MLKFILFLIIVSIFCGTAFSKELNLFEGQKFRLKATGHLLVDKLENLKIIDLGKNYELLGKKKGISLIRVDDETFEINVLSLKQQSTYDFLKSKTKSRFGLDIEVKSGQIILNGYLYDRFVLESIISHCQQVECEYSNHLQLDKSTEQYLREKFLQDLKKYHLNEIKFNFKSFTAYVKENTPHFKAYEKLISSYGLQLRKDVSILELEPMIKVQITIAEIKKSYTLKYGLRWPNGYAAQVLPNNIDPIALNLEALESNGEGKILAHPSLLCRNDKEAEFLAGGEFPIKIVNFKTQEISWKKYGILLKVKPKADLLGQMSVAIETEVSSIDNSRTVEGIPALFTNKVQSFFDLKEKQTIALSGLIKSEQGTSQEGLPLLSKIPILSSLFSSKDFMENRSELIIFVTPEVVTGDN